MATHLVVHLFASDSSPCSFKQFLFIAPKKTLVGSLSKMLEEFYEKLYDSLLTINRISFENWIDLWDGYSVGEVFGGKGQLYAIASEVSPMKKRRNAPISAKYIQTPQTPIKKRRFSDCNSLRENCDASKDGMNLKNWSVADSSDDEMLLTEEIATPLLNSTRRFSANYTNESAVASPPRNVVEKKKESVAAEVDKAGLKSPELHTTNLVEEESSHNEVAVEETAEVEEIGSDALENRTETNVEEPEKVVEESKETKEEISNKEEEEEEEEESEESEEESEEEAESESESEETPAEVEQSTEEAKETVVENGAQEESIATEISNAVNATETNTNIANEEESKEANESDSSDSSSSEEDSAIEESSDEEQQQKIKTPLKSIKSIDDIKQLFNGDKEEAKPKKKKKKAKTNCGLYELALDDN